MHPEGFWNTGLSTAIILLGALVVFALPTWIPLMRKKPDRPFTYKLALRVTAINEVVQAFFILGCGLNFFPLSYSWRYAGLGLPLSLAGAGFASHSLIADRHGAGCLVSAIFSGLLWLILISMH
jgi:hypothetical protein